MSRSLTQSASLSLVIVGLMFYMLMLLLLLLEDARVLTTLLLGLIMLVGPLPNMLT